MSPFRMSRAALAALGLVAAAPAFAADLAYPPPYPPEPGPSRVYREERVEELQPPPPPPPAYGPRFSAGPGFGCRTVVKRRIDEDGEEFVRKVRICDEPVPYPRLEPEPGFRPSFYRPHPVPPADVPEGGWDAPPRW